VLRKEILHKHFIHRFPGLTKDILKENCGKHV